MTYKKEITIDDAAKFWQLLEQKHPNVSKYAANHALINGDIVFFAGKVKNDRFEVIFGRFLQRWLSDNGFCEAEPDIIVVTVKNSITKSVRALDTSKIVSIDKTPHGFGKVVYDDDGMLIDIFITENVDEFREDVYIF